MKRAIVALSAWSALVATSAIAASPDQIERGRYLAAAGDCKACHTPFGAAPFSGGRPLQTPFGTLLSANLTPDRDTGIGRYTPDTFYRALHEGVDPEGRHLYPAFPYNYYTRLSREDSDALFAWLRTLPPVRHPVDRNRLPFPFNIRSLMAVWNALYLDDRPFAPDASKSAQWNRGAYLVQGLGHCEACHTDKDMLGGNRKGQALQGGRFGAWFAPDLTPNRRTGLGAWKAEEVVEFLREGRNVHSGATAEMGEVVQVSTSSLTDADLAAIATYLASLPPSPDAAITRPDAAQMKQGEAIWQDQCAGCHRQDGRGAAKIFPPVAGSAIAQQRDPATVLRYVIAGARRAPTPRSPTMPAMPAFGWKLDDAQVAAVASYARNSWGNAADAVTAAQAAEMRRTLGASAVARAASAPPADLHHPGPATLAPADTDSRDNGTPDAGRAHGR